MTDKCAQRMSGRKQLRMICCFQQRRKSICLSFFHYKEAAAMEWVKIIGMAIDYIEAHLLEDITVEDTANFVHISPFYFHKGFGMLCGYSFKEYVRNRRLSLAGGELITSDISVIDLALKYGYDSPDSFSQCKIPC